MANDNPKRKRLEPRDRIALAGVLSAAVLGLASLAISIRGNGDNEASLDKSLGEETEIDGGSTTSDDSEPPDLDVNRALSLGATPTPGLNEGVLGWGDELGGRPTYSYDRPPAGLDSTPGLNAWVDVPHGVDDERPFLTARVGASGQAWHNVHRGQRIVTVEEGQAAWLRVYAGNSTYALDNCSKMEGEYVARDVTVSLAMWKDPAANGRFVVRAWLTGSNTKPTWVTDAIVIYSSSGELTYDATQSFYYQQPLASDGTPLETNSERDGRHSLTGDPFLDGGTQINEAGDLGSCWTNRWVGMVALVP